MNKKITFYEEMLDKEILTIFRKYRTDFLTFKDIR